MDEKDLNNPAPETPETGKTPEPASAPTPAETAEKKRRRGRRIWRWFIAVYTVLFLGAGLWGCRTLYRYLEAYEAARPEQVMDGLMARTDADTWKDYARLGLAQTLSEFDDADELFRQYDSALLDSDSFTYREEPGASSDDKMVYRVRCGGVDVCRVTLLPVAGTDLGFGLHMWQLGEIVPIPAGGNLEAVTVEVEALRGSAVYLNGIPLGEEYIVDHAVPLEDMEELEKRFDVVPALIRYRVDALYGQVTVTDGNGNELLPVSVSDDGVARYFLTPERYSFSLVAPEDITVRVNGGELTKADALSSDRGILIGLEGYLDGEGYDTCVYEYSGLYTPPEIRAWDTDGTPLEPYVTPGGRIYYFHANDPSLEYSAVEHVRYFFRRYIDYCAHPFLGSLSITREALDDPAIELSDTERASMQRYYYLLDTILAGTDLYSRVANSTDGMTWASSTNVSYNDLEFSDFSYVSNRVLFCTVRYQGDFSAWTWSENYTYQMGNVYEMVFVNRWGWWFAAAMSVIPD